jgi:hypothetical protein
MAPAALFHQQSDESMKDSIQNINNADDPNKGQGWEDPAFSWDNMRDGIFEKVVKEDPDFFKEKRRRRVPIWFWFCAAILAGGGLFYSLNKGSEPTKPSIPSQPNKSAITSEKDRQVAANTQVEVAHQAESLTAFETITNPTTSSRPKAKSNRTNMLSGQIKSAVFNQIQPLQNQGNFVDNQDIAKQSSSMVPLAEAPIETTEIEKPIELNLGQKTAKLSILGISPLTVHTKTPSVHLVALPVIVPQKEKEKYSWSILATSGGLISGSKYTGSSGSVALRNGHSSPWFGYQYGVGIGASIAKKGQLFLNLNRQVAYQNIDISTIRRVEKTIPNALLSVERFVVGNRVIETHGDTTVGATEKNRLVHYNEQKSLQGQLGYAWSLNRKYWHFSLNSGLAIGYVTKQDGFTVAEDGAILGFNNNSPIFRNFQFAPFAGLGIERDLGRRFAINMNYQIQKQVNNASLEASTQFTPVFHSLSLGARLKLGKN